MICLVFKTSVRYNINIKKVELPGRLGSLRSRSANKTRAGEQSSPGAERQYKTKNEKRKTKNKKQKTQSKIKKWKTKYENEN